MAGSNDFLAFGTASGANVLSQASYAALAARTAGFASGLATSAQLNKVWRQSSFVTSAIAQWMANQTGTNIYDDGNQANFITNFIAALANTGRIRLSADLTIYVATTGNASTNTGLTVGSPFLTVQRAWSFLQQNYDLNGYVVTISVADGTYSAGVSCNGPLVGQSGATTVVFSGNTTTPTNCIINIPSNTNGFGAQNGAAISVQGFQLTGAGTNNTRAIYAGIGGQINIYNNNFGNFTGGTNSAHMTSDSFGEIFLFTSYTISGGATYHILSEGRVSFVNLSPATVTISGTPNFVYFVFATLAGNVQIASSSITWSGAATGTRYYSQLNAIIATSGSGATYFPGNVAGSTATGGQYA